MNGRSLSAADAMARQVPPATFSTPIPEAQLATPGNSLPIPPNLQPVEGATIIARVGNSVVLEREVLRFVNSVLAENADRIPESHRDEVRSDLMKKALQPLIETKMVMEDVRSQLPEAQLKSLEERLGEEFEKKEVKRLLEQMQLKTRPELEAKLNSLGSSIQREKQAFIERTIARTWVHQRIEIDEEVSHEEMLARYREHIDRFQVPAEARWQELQVRFDRFPSKDDAYRAIADMGNMVLSGVPLEQVARQYSQGATASDGGVWDWTSRGSLVSDVLDKALFTLPVGSLSQILETEDGFHIIRVIERHDAGVTPFVDAQVELRKEIRDERFKAELQRYLKDLQSRVPVWTIFDGHVAGPNASAPDGDARTTLEPSMAR